MQSNCHEIYMRNNSEEVITFEARAAKTPGAEISVIVAFDAPSAVRIRYTGSVRCGLQASLSGDYCSRWIGFAGGD